MPNIRPFTFLGVLWLISAVQCEPVTNRGEPVFTYSEKSSFCLDCPSFELEIHGDGSVRLVGLSASAIPGEYRYQIPEADVAQLAVELNRNGFFSIPTNDPSRIVSDVPNIRLAFRDHGKAHEVVDIGRNSPVITQLEQSLRKIAQVDRYLNPSVELYRQLVDGGWDVNTVGKNHENALTKAVYSDDDESVAFLLEHGATVSRQAFESSLYSKSPTLFRLLAANGRLNYRSAEAGMLLSTAVHSRNVALVRELLESGAPVNLPSRRGGLTPLAVAAGGDYVESAALLIRHGADVNSREESGETPLFFAATSVETGVLSLLLEHGADVNAQDKFGRTALIKAANYCRPQHVKVLLAHGADLSLKDRGGRSALDTDIPLADRPDCAASKKLLSEAAQRPR